MRAVLIANRGEIAVRIIRACRDAGLRSIAVYADGDIDALHCRLADEAFALSGTTPGQTYLDAGKLLAVASRSGADAVHPGYGFLSENADFAQAVVDAGRTWIGPPAAAIRLLGDKVAARQIALAVGAPLVAGTLAPVSGAGEVREFAAEHGLPVVIKAAFGGGGRGLKVARSMAEIAALYESAVREAEHAFGRGECFVERYLDRPRHVEAQVLADQHGAVVVVGDRDCSLQRRHQKLVEEAPAPFLTPEQRAQIHLAAQAICAQAGYVGAGTVEFLIGTDGTVSFLEVNTRLQVEHPVTEAVSGLDLVREQFRIADCQHLGYQAAPVIGHAIEFRINAEDPYAGFLPSPGLITCWEVPAGPGVRLDSGVAAGTVVDGTFDSLLAKLIVSGATRADALARASRALGEFVVEGVPTVIGFHRSVVADPAFSAEPFGVHTSWIESSWLPSAIASSSSDPATIGGAWIRNDRVFADRYVSMTGSGLAGAGAGAGERRTLTVEVDGRRLSVVLPADFGADSPGRGPAGAGAAAAPPKRQHRRATSAAATDGDALLAPMQGTIVAVAVAEGDRVAAGDLVVVLEAMKMEQRLTAHRSGLVSDLTASVGAVVASGAAVCRISD